MSNDEFDALVALVQAICRSELEMQENPRDGTRMSRVIRDRDDEIEIARRVLVL